METGSINIEHVTDTALWVATYRDDETHRPHPIFRDPLAGVLAGERGKKIAANMPFQKIMSWVLVIRTVAIDRLITRAFELGVDTVVNLGAGLDARPYRMPLPSSLHWVEIDFPPMIHYKNQKLVGEKPVCSLERVAADLSDIPGRRKLFDQIGSRSKKALIITEGLIPYLSNEEAISLSEDLFTVPAFQYWIQDYRQGEKKQWAPRKLKKALKDAPFKFNATDWLKFFTEQGWQIGEKILAIDEAKRIHRPFPFIFPWSLILWVLPPKKREKWREASGYVMYKKS